VGRTTVARAAGHVLLTGARHTEHVTDATHLWIWAIPLILGSPWLAASIYLWRRLPRDGFVPPSMGELARKRL
jgi:hypothetical protein